MSFSCFTSPYPHQPNPCKDSEGEVASQILGPSTQGGHVFWQKLAHLGAPAMAQQVKDSAWLLLWHRLQVPLGFHPWPGNLHVQLVCPPRSQFFC